MRHGCGRLARRVAHSSANVVSHALGSNSIYVERLLRRGVQLDRGREELVMYDLRVADLMGDVDGLTIPPDATVHDLLDLFAQTIKHRRVGQMPPVPCQRLAAEFEQHPLICRCPVLHAHPTPRPVRSGRSVGRGRSP